MILRDSHALPASWLIVPSVVRLTAVGSIPNSPEHAADRQRLYRADRRAVRPPFRHDDREIA
jgi:hypothetical protein